MIGFLQIGAFLGGLISVYYLYEATILFMHGYREAAIGVIMRAAVSLALALSAWRGSTDVKNKIKDQILSYNNLSNEEQDDFLRLRATRVNTYKPLDKEMQYEYRTVKFVVSKKGDGRYSFRPTTVQNRRGEKVERG